MATFFTGTVDLHVNQAKLQGQLKSAEQRVFKSIDRMSNQRIKATKLAVNDKKKLIMWEDRRSKIALRNVRQEMTANQKAMNLQLGRAMAFRQLGMMATVAGAAILAVNAKMIQSYGKFEQSMRRATAVSTFSLAEFNKMSSMAEEQSIRLNISASHAADAFYFLGSAGLSVTEQMQAFVPTVTLAKAAVIEAGVAAEILVDTIKGFKLNFADAGHVTDILAKAVISSNMNFLDLGETLSLVAGVARTTNNTLAETVAAIELMANVGIKGTRAGTTLRRSLLNLAAPSSKISGLFKTYGINISDASGKLKPYITLVGELGVVLNQASEAERNLAFRTLFGARAIAGQLEVFDAGADKVRAMAIELELAGGTAEEIANKQMVAFSEQVGILGKEFEQLARHVAREAVPALKVLTEWAGSAVKGLTKLADTFPNLAGGLVMASSSMGTVMTVAGGLTMILSQLTLVAWGFHTSLLALTTTVAPWLIGIALVTVAFATFANVAARAKLEQDELNESIKDSAKKLKDTKPKWEEYLKLIGDRQVEKGSVSIPKNAAFGITVTPEMQSQLLETYEQRYKRYKNAIIKDNIDLVKSQKGTSAEIFDLAKKHNVPIKHGFTSATFGAKPVKTYNFQEIQTDTQKVIKAHRTMLEKQLDNLAGSFAEEVLMEQKKNQEITANREGVFKAMKDSELKSLGDLLDSTLGMETQALQARKQILKDQVSEYKNAMNEINSTKELTAKRNSLIDEWEAQQSIIIQRDAAIEIGTLRQGFRARAAQIGEELKSVGEIGASIADSMQTSFASAFEGILTGARSLKESVVDFASMMMGALMKLAAQQLAMGLMSAMFGATPSPQISGPGGTGPMAAPMKKHSGGLISGATMGGLKQDEFPAILQQGERVVPRGTNMNQSQPNIIINFEDNTQKGVTPTDKGTSFDGKSFIRKIIIEDSITNGPMKQAGAIN